MESMIPMLFNYTIPTRIRRRNGLTVNWHCLIPMQLLCWSVNYVNWWGGIVCFISWGIICRGMVDAMWANWLEMPLDLVWWANVDRKATSNGLGRCAGAGMLNRRPSNGSERSPIRAPIDVSFGCFISFSCNFVAHGVQSKGECTSVRNEVSGTWRMSYACGCHW